MPGDDYIQANGDDRTDRIFCGDGSARIVAGKEDLINGKRAREAHHGKSFGDCKIVYVK